MQRLTVTQESWPITGGFTISRGSKTAAEVVLVSLESDGVEGQGECVPYRHYGESVEGVVEALESVRGVIEGGIGHNDIPRLLAPRAARNALDCALWDLEAKRARQPAWRLLQLSEPAPLVTAFTLSLAPAEEMGRAAAQAADRPLLKVKLGGRSEDDAERLRAIRRAAPGARLIVDANEGWRAEDLAGLVGVCAETGVELIEQPLPAGKDEPLRGIDRRSVVICADESAHDVDGLASLIGKYDAINIKLDKTGGLTPALALRRAAETLGLEIMVGCMLATSLSMAPAQLVAQGARFVDLDGPLLLARDRVPGIRYDGSSMQPAPRELWG